MKIQQFAGYEPSFIGNLKNNAVICLNLNDLSINVGVVIESCGVRQLKRVKYEGNFVEVVERKNDRFFLFVSSSSLPRGDYILMATPIVKNRRNTRVEHFGLPKTVSFSVVDYCY